MLQTTTTILKPAHSTSRAEDADKRRQRIRQLNDEFRCQRNGQALTLGRVLKTAGVGARFGWADQFSIMERVKAFDAFTPDNDPHGEHDLGAFWFKGAHIFWKIDCYDLGLERGAPDASDPQRSTRVLTVMLAEEY